MSQPQLGQQSVFDMIQSAYAARALCVLTKIGTFESLAAGPKTLEQLSQASGTKAGILHDLLRFAIAMRFIRVNDGQYALAKKGLTWRPLKNW